MKHRSIVYTQLNDQFLIIQFVISHLFVLSLNVKLFYNIRPYPVLLLLARVNLEMMAIKGYLAFPKASVLLEPIFIAASHQTGLDTRSMTRRSIKVGIRGGRARAETRALVTMIHLAPPEGFPAEVRGLTASCLPLLDRSHWRTSVWSLTNR